MDANQDPPLHASAPDGESNFSIEVLKWRTYMVALLMGVLALSMGWWIESRATYGDPFNSVAYPLMASSLAVVAVGLWRWKERLREAESIVLSIAATYFIAKICYIFYIAPLQANVQVEYFKIVSWLPNIYLALFLIHDRRRGLLSALTFYVVTLAITLPHVASAFSAGQMGELELLIQLYISGAACIALLYTFAKVRDYYSQTQARAEAMEYLATRDFLTGLANRRMLYDMLAKEIEQSSRYGRSLSLVVFDLDHFKGVNDSYGHDVGDMVLKEVAKLVSQHLRQSDLLARWGGEEFAILCVETELGQAVQLAERLKKVLANNRLKRVGTVTASFGATSYAVSDSAESLLKRADEALYKAKAGGRNRVVALAAPTPPLPPASPTLYQPSGSI